MLVGPVSGYSTQAQVSLDVAEMINDGRIRFWFATQFNPIDNEPRSRPLRIFEELDRAAKTRDVSSEKATNVADNLRAWVNRWEADELIDRETQGRALQAIKTAFEDEGFHPRVFYLSQIVGAAKESQPDEYTVENQQIRGSQVRQILPPQEAS